MKFGLNELIETNYEIWHNQNVKKILQKYRKKLNAKKQPQRIKLNRE